MIEEFKAQKETLKSLKKEVVGIIAKILNDQSEFIPHLIVGRVKKVDSLIRKIKSKVDKYDSLWDITDLVGVRVITYLDSDVDKVASLISKEFNVDELNSQDKRNLKANEFGYKSLHYVVSLSDIRSSLPENKKYNSIKFEIQIRSILQHAWAEIEHDLGYKTEQSVPDIFRRRFNRLSALLEVADVEFDKLKKDLDEYRNELPVLVNNNSDVDLNQDSLIYLAINNPVLARVRQKYLDDLNWKLVPATSEDTVAQISRFKMLGYETINKIQIVIESDKKHILRFILDRVERMRDRKPNTPERDDLITTFHLLIYLAAKSRDVDIVKSFLKGNGSIYTINGDPAALIEEYLTVIKLEE